ARGRRARMSARWSLGSPAAERVRDSRASANRDSRRARSVPGFFVSGTAGRVSCRAARRCFGVCSAAMRIVSLLASGTELTCALGAGEQLVGRSHECDYPEWVKELPVVSEPTFDVSGSSGEIDRLVRARLRAGLPLYRV